LYCSRPPPAAAWHHTRPHGTTPPQPPHQPYASQPAPPHQVPTILYDRSVAVFGAALIIDVLNSLFELRTTKLDFALLPCFIKGMATTTNVLMRSGLAVIRQGPGGRM